MDFRLTAIKREGLPEVLENKGTRPFTFREQGNKMKIKLGTPEQKHILGNREHQNRRNTFREHENTTEQNVSWERGNMDSPWEAFKPLRALSLLKLYDFQFYRYQGPQYYHQGVEKILELLMFKKTKIQQNILLTKSLEIYRMITFCYNW